LLKEKERLQLRAAELTKKKAEHAEAPPKITSYEAPDLVHTKREGLGSSPSLTVTESPSASLSVDAPAPKQKRTHSRIVRDNASRAVTSLDVEGLEAPKKASGGVANLWAQKMAAKQEDEYQANRAKRKGRVNGGIKFMDNQIRQLIVEVVKLGKTSAKPTPAGRAGIAPSVCYGDLFNATVATMPALSATLHTAKKRGVVAYDGDMLMQGFHDDVVITLLCDEIEDTPEFKSRIIMRPNAKTATEAHVPGRCSKCTKIVYPMERLCANEVVFHKACFRCQVCDRTLKLTAYAFLDGKFYCEPDFERMFKANASYITTPKTE
jgi:hypothetical protein